MMLMMMAMEATIDAGEKHYYLTAFKPKNLQFRYDLFIFFFYSFLFLVELILIAEGGREKERNPEKKH